MARAQLKTSGSGELGLQARTSLPIIASSGSQEGPFGARQPSEPNVTVNGERVQLLLKRCIAFGDEGNRSCDVFFTDYRICFVGKAGTDVAILHAVVERIRAYPVDKNVPSNLRVPDGNLSDFALFNVSGHSIYVEIFCKYFRTVYFAFNPKPMQHPSAITALLQSKVSLSSIEFAYAFQAGKRSGAAVNPPKWSHYDAKAEYERQGLLNPNSNWRLTTLNEKYTFSETYPAVLAVPKRVTDEVLKKAAAFRSKARLTVLAYKHHNHASICRSSQPLVGISQSRSMSDTRDRDDENVLAAIRDTNPFSEVLYIADSRPMMNAVANQALNGAGFETGYVGCQLKFFNIPNIHATRDSYKKLRTAVANEDAAHWLQSVEATAWLEYLRLILVGAVYIVEKLEVEQASVLCHCSDGWDRTAQMVSLAELCLDPYFRTISGFQVLIEKEWVSFGHKFADRNGHLGTSPADDRCPIFAQFIECVWCLLQQFPSAFQFNESLLITVLDAVYSCEYGNFLCNTEREAVELMIKDRAPSLWTSVDERRDFFSNPLYHATETHDIAVLVPSTHPARITLWTTYHLRYVPSFATKERFNGEMRLVWDADRTKSSEIVRRLREAERASPPASPPAVPFLPDPLREENRKKSEDLLRALTSGLVEEP